MVSPQDERKMDNQISNPSRLVLEGVPQVHFYEGGKRCPEDIPFPSVLRACLEFMGEKDFGCKHCLAKNPDRKINCTYSYLLGTSGYAFFLSWKPGWHGGNVAFENMTTEAYAPYQRAFDSVGYGVEWVLKEEGRDNETVFRQRIIESIQKGLPALGFGVIGPPEPSIITGYDEGGEVLLGWSFFQKFPEFNAGVEFEPSGYFRKRGWFKDTETLGIITGKKERPPMGEIGRKALLWGLEVARTPLVNDRHNGLAAYTAWAEHLLKDEDFPTDNEAVLREHHMVHNDTVGTVAEARWYGGQFLIQMADPDNLHFKMAEELLRAAACFAGEHELMWKVWDLAGGNGNPDAYKTMAVPAVRRQMVPIILQSRDKLAEATEHIEKALGK
jgi:hypothetical protein